MRFPAVWRDTLEHGYVTTDMIDAAALAMHSTALRWLTKANSAKKTLEKKPESAAAQRRYERAMLMSYKYSRLKSALIAILPPNSAIILKRKNKPDICYITYKIGDHTYLEPITAKEGRRFANKHHISLTSTNKLRHPTYELGNVPSLHTVLNILSTMHSMNIAEAIDTGSFNPSSPEWEPTPLDWNTVDRGKLIPLAEFIADTMPDPADEK